MEPKQMIYGVEDLPQRLILAAARKFQEASTPETISCTRSELDQSVGKAETTPHVIHGHRRLGRNL